MVAIVPVAAESGVVVLQAPFLPSQSLLMRLRVLRLHSWGVECCQSILWTSFCSVVVWWWL